MRLARFLCLFPVMTILHTIIVTVLISLNLNEVVGFQSPFHHTSDRRQTRLQQLTDPSRSELSPDDIRRRQLLMSMLAAASMESKSAKAAVEPVDLEQEGEEFRGVIKPPLDDREYLSLTLPNGLRVLLCSDDNSKEAAAAMDVHVGATSDPDNVPGLAHFNEHMLFLGTKDFPKENSFEAFLAANGGSSNAYTASEDTVYYFDMEAETSSRLAEGLKRFGSFFTSPLFTEAATGRELNAIESEHSKNLQTDSFRIFQIEKGRSNPKHPFSKFYTGNKKTLLDDTKAAGIDLRNELIQFYNSHYSANQMTLAVIAPQPIQQLRTMVVDAFGGIPNKQVEKPEIAWAGVPPIAPDSSIPSVDTIVEIVPVQDLRQVSLAWPIAYGSDTAREEELLNKPTSYVAHLIGHEGPRSLLSYLKKKGWASSISCGNSEELSDFEVFQVVVGLTTSGLDNVESVVESIYSYINMLRQRSIPSYVFEEVLQLEELSWRFTTKGSPRNLVSSLAASMQQYPPTLYVAGPRRLALDEYKFEGTLTDAPRAGFSTRAALDRTRRQAQSYVDQLTVDSALISVLSKTFAKSANRKEPVYGTAYQTRKVPPTVSSQWRNGVRAEQIKVDFPKPNPFVPSEAGLVVKNEPFIKPKPAKSFEDRIKPLSPPKVLRDDGPEGKWKVFFKRDDRFFQPKGYMIFQVATKELFSSPKQAVMASLFELSIADKLGEYAYDASLAGLTYDLRILPRGIRLTFGGYTEKLKRFASYISLKLSTEIGDLLPKTQVLFDGYKDQVIRGLSAFDAKQPYSHAAYYSQIALQPPNFQYDNSDMRDALLDVTLSDLNEYANKIWSSGRGEALIQGNFDEQEALSLIDSIGLVLPFRPTSEVPDRLQALPLPAPPTGKRPTRLRILEPNPANTNAVSTVMLQSLGTTERDHVLMELISSIISEPFYDELRTKKQLGYIVSSGIRGISNTRTMTFIVQSSVATSDRLTDEIFLYLDQIQNRLDKIKEVDFAIYVKSLLDRKTEPDKELATEVTRNWSEIASGREQFDRIPAEAAAILALERPDLGAFWRNLYTEKSRILITEVIPQQGPIQSDLKPPIAKDIGLQLGLKDLQGFREDRSAFLSTSS